MKFDLAIVKKSMMTLVGAGVLFGSSVSAFAATIPMGPYVVQANQSPYAIALQTQVSLQNFEKVNHLTSASEIYPGEAVAIPFLYSVNPGDSLWYIANHYNTTVASIKQLNGLTSTLIFPGQTLLVASGSHAMSPTTNAGESISGDQQNTSAQTSSPSATDSSNSASPQVSAVARSVVTPQSQIAAPSSTQAVNMVATSYDASAASNGPWGAVNYFGKPLQFGDVAVDPSVIPLGSKLFISGYSDPALPRGGFYATANDVGGAIKGNRLDIFLPTASQANQFGIENIKVQVISK